MFMSSLFFFNFSKQEAKNLILTSHSNECSIASINSSSKSTNSHNNSAKYSDSSGSSSVSVDMDRWNTPNNVNNDLNSFDWSNGQSWNNLYCPLTESSIRSSSSCSSSAISSPEQFLSCSFSSPQSMTSPGYNNVPATTPGYTSVIVDTQQYVSEYAVH